MDEAEQAIADLKAYRALLVAARRRLVALGVHGNKNAIRAPGAPYEPAIGPSIGKSAELRALQDDVDAVSRAIRDEHGELAP